MTNHIKAHLIKFLITEPHGTGLWPSQKVCRTIHCQWFGNGHPHWRLEMSQNDARTFAVKLLSENSSFREETRVLVKKSSVNAL